MQNQPTPVVLLFAAVLPWLPSCGSDNTRFGPEQRFSERERPIEWNADDRTRLQLRSMGATGGGDGMAPQGGDSFTAPTPTGWKQLSAEPSMFKDLNFEVAGNPEATCYLTGAVGGGIEGNVARWYGQMGAKPSTDALPQAELMGRPASLVEIEGNYLGGKPEYKLLGLITAQGQQCTTLKLIGPRSVVDAEKARFLELAKAIRRGAAAAAPAAGDGGELVATTPPGWQPLPPEPAMFKDLNYEVGGNPDATCYLTAAVNGGLEGNLQRWYQQMQAEAPATGAMALPRAELMGRSGYLVELAGSYKGKADFALLGLITAAGDVCTTLKLIGPKDLVAAEKQHFLDLAKSIHRGAAASPANEAKGPLSDYKVPAGWKEVPSTSSMRLFTFQVGEQTELSVIMLGGEGGGVRANLDRWRQQMGQQALSDAEFQAMPQIEVFGARSPLLELRGKLTDGMTGRAFDDAAFLGVVTLQPDGAFFFKFTGPHAEAQAHRQEFLDFCASLRR